MVCDDPIPVPDEAADESTIHQEDERVEKTNPQEKAPQEENDNWANRITEEDRRFAVVVEAEQQTESTRLQQEKMESERLRREAERHVAAAEARWSPQCNEATAKKPMIIAMDIPSVPFTVALRRPDRLSSNAELMQVMPPVQ